MSTVDISLPEPMKQDRQQLRPLLLAGAASAPGAPVDDAYFDGLRARVRAPAAGARIRPDDPQRLRRPAQA